MAKKNSFNLNCLNCKTEWKIGYNRIRQNKITSCPKCLTMPTEEQIDNYKMLIELKK